MSKMLFPRVKTIICCIVILIAITILPFATIVFIDYIPKFNRQEIAKFEPFREDFNMITDYLIETLGDNYDEYIIVGNESDDLTYLEHSTLGRIDLPTEIADAFSRISSIFHYPEMKIWYTEKKVAIGGYFESYVYSRKMGIPSHFSFPEFSFSEDIYILKGKWYFIVASSY